DPDSWLLENPGFVSGGNLRWWRDHFFGPDSEYDAICRPAADVAPGAEGLVFLPCMQGAMAPEWNGAARGVFFGLSLAHTRAHMTRALLQGSAFALRDILEAMQNARLDLEGCYPAVVTGEGAWVEASSGKRYLDAMSGGSMAATLGHGGGDIIAAAAAQAIRLSYVHNERLTNPAREQLAAELVELGPPGMTRVRFTTGGAESNEMAIQ